MGTERAEPWARRPWEPSSLGCGIALPVPVTPVGRKGSGPRLHPGPAQQCRLLAERSHGSGRWTLALRPGPLPTSPQVCKQPKFGFPEFGRRPQALKFVMVKGEPQESQEAPC